MGEDRQGGRHHQRTVSNSLTAKVATDAKEKNKVWGGSS